MTMFRRAAAVTGLACLLLAGCGADPPSTTSENSDSVAVPGEGLGDPTDDANSDALDVPGAPQADGNGGAVPAPGAPQPKKGKGPVPGSPMRMPARTIDEGVDLEPKLAEIKRELRQQCGGSMCVNVVVEYSYPDRTQCQYMDSVPAPESTFPYRPDMEIRIIAGRDPCTEPSSESPSSSPSDEEPPPGEEPGEVPSAVES